uniref:Ubiquitin-conjugating enzyme E2-binding protein n=1 Tax=Vitis vinifera TaxID=29760 RepID=F6GWT0_VITVI
MEDHIEVKLVLLLPVDHHIVSNFNSILNMSEATSQLFSMDSDIKSLSSRGGVHFYCKSCSTNLTKKPLSSFAEMPSINWREVADNWFGACCCSFGGISEKLVARYANSYSCGEESCLLDATSVILCKDDLVGFEFPDRDGDQNYESEPDCTEDDCINEDMQDAGGNHGRCVCPTVKKEKMSDLSGKLNSLHIQKEPFEQKVTKASEVLANKKSFLNGFLGNIFMARSYNLSKDVEWIKFACPQCSSLLGAYPCADGYAPLDGGVRLFKCYISTCLPVCESGDLFRKYTLERMFTSQLLESAKDELSFRTVVRDLRTKSPVLQIVLLNPNSWCCTGYCLGTEDTVDPVANINLYPAIKVLFSDCSYRTESQIRMIEEWVTKNQADEVYMLDHLISELIVSLEAAMDMYPPSYTFLQGLPLSSLPR